MKSLEALLLSSLFSFGLVVLVPLGTPLAALAGDGSGVNGPDLKGIAVPIQAEGPIPVDRLAAAQQACLAPVAERLLKQALPSADMARPDWFGQAHEGGYSAVHGRFLDGVLAVTDVFHTAIKGDRLQLGIMSNEVRPQGELCVESNQEIRLVAEEAIAPFRRSIEWADVPGQLKRCYVPSFGIQSGITYWKNEVIRFEIREFPRFEYKAVDISEYDDWGNVWVKRMGATELKVVSGADLPVDAALINEATQHESAFRVNLRDYRDCLVREVQK